MDEKLKGQYREVLEGYLLHNDEGELYKASILSRELIKSRVGPDEIVATHFETLNRIMPIESASDPTSSIVFRPNRSARKAPGGTINNQDRK